jgi:hypothetical protein
MVDGGHADIFKFASIELNALRAHDLLQDQTPDVVADGQSVGLGFVVHVVGLDDASGAGHILDDDAGTARDMLADMATNGSSVGVEAASGAKGHDHAHRLAFVELVR